MPINSTMFFTDINQGSDVNLNLQLSMIKDRLDSFEKHIINQNTNGSTNSTNQLVNRMNQLSCTDRLEAIRLSYLSGNERIESDPFSLNTILLQRVKILDFSPEWDYTSGGSKLLIWFKPDLTNLIDPDSGIDVYEAIENRFQIRFGETDVPVKFIQRGVMKCHAPPNPPGYVELKLLYDGQSINENCKENSDLFQYRENQNIKRKTWVRARDDHNTLLNNEPREFKVRLIEALSGLEHDINWHSCQNSSSSKSQKERPNINFEQLKHLDIQILEKINRGYFIRVIRLIFNKMMNIFGKEKSARMINKRDPHGLSIVHYIVCLDYYELIHDLYEAGADLSLPTLIPGKKWDDMIPIVICSAKGFENTLSELLKYVPTPYTVKEKEKRLEWSLLAPETRVQNSKPLSQGSVEHHDSDSDEEAKSIDGPFEVAFNNNHHEILEILLREMTLQKALRTDDSSESGDIDLKQQSLLRSLDNLWIDHPDSPPNQAKGRIKQLLYRNNNNNANRRNQEEVQKRMNIGNFWVSNNTNEDNIDDDSYFVKNSEGYKIEVITDEMIANNLISNPDQANRRNTNPANEESAVFNSKTKIKKSCSSNTKQMDSLVDNHNQMFKEAKCSKKRINMLTNLKCWIKDLKLIQKLQRKVKNWLIKRQAKDVYHASNVLTNEMKKKCKIGVNQKDAIVFIQRAFRAYLAEKAHIY